VLVNRQREVAHSSLTAGSVPLAQYEHLEEHLSVAHMRHPSVEPLAQMQTTYAACSLIRLGAEKTGVNMRDLNNKLVWITGAGTGIGAAGAEKLAHAGCTVVLSGRRAEPLEAIAQTIRTAGGKASVEVLDVADRDAVAAVAARIFKEHGTVDVLINNAGINVPNRHWADVSHDDWDAVINIDLNGAFYCTQAVLPGMRNQGEGLVINVSSWAGVKVSFLTGPAYTAAKHAMNAMTESLNMEECVNGIRACAICPGEVSTPIMDRRPVPMSAQDRARMVQPEDLGDTILFVTSMPTHVCINELIISPTWNRGYVRVHENVGPE
jgi:NADP-dependent 3-hydroxy acid dehydrogenase YdfG